MAKLGLISDIHGNLDALQAVLEVIDRESCDEIYCLGDVVGYGACPAQCIEILRTRKIPCVLGNHDEYASSFDDSGYAKLRDDVKKSIAWTQQHLQFDDLDWLLRLPAKLEVHGLTLIHGSFAPHRWSYCMNQETFALNFKYQKPQLAFCGHSHYPSIGVALSEEGMPYVDNIRQDVIVPSESKVMINVGSVGQSRDNDPRAAFVTYETETRKLNLVRVEYDIAAAQQKIYDSGLPRIFGQRLAIGR